MQMTRLIPMLPARSIAASIAFYEKLGFTVEQRNDGWGWVGSDANAVIDKGRHPRVREDPF